VGVVGERREEENGRRGYGKRAGTSCEVRAARHEIASFAIDRAKKGRRTSAGEGPSPSLAVARPAGRSFRQDWSPSPSRSPRQRLLGATIHRFKKRSRI